MFKIWVLRKTHREGKFYPHLFGLDPYIALFAEKYRPQPIEDDAVLFVAEDQLSPAAVGLGWAQVVRGRLDIQKIPGAHQTIFTRPNVTEMARELTKRLSRQVDPPPPNGPVTGKSAPAYEGSALLECHGG